LAEVLTSLGVTQWNVCLIGDGSGCKADDPGGWGCTLIDRLSGQREVFWGGFNKASVYTAEIMAYITAMTWYVGDLGKQARRQLGQVRICVVTDSQSVANAGNKAAAATALTDPAFKDHAVWAQFAVWRSQGFEFEWKWADRDEIALNVLADALSVYARDAMKRLPEVFQAELGGSPLAEAQSYNSRETRRC